MDGCGMLMEGQDSHDTLPALQAVKGIQNQVHFRTAWSYLALVVTVTLTQPVSAHA